MSGDIVVALCVPIVLLGGLAIADLVHAVFINFRNRGRLEVDDE